MSVLQGEPLTSLMLAVSFDQCSRAHARFLHSDKLPLSRFLPVGTDGQRGLLPHSSHDVAVPRSLDTYALAVEGGRFFDAATDNALWTRWKEHADPVARALLILAAAYLHESRGNGEGVRRKLERVPPYLAQAPDEPLAEWLTQRVVQALAALDANEPLPPLRLEDAPH